jgi:hypothetical protein
VTGNSIPLRIVRLRVHAGALFADEMMLNVACILEPTDPLIVKYGLFRGALLATSAIWQPFWGCVSAFRMDYWKGPIVPGAPVIHYNRFHIPWIAYISPKLATGLVAPPPDMRTEHAPGGGLLLSATEERFDPTNPEYLRRSLVLAETMVARTGEKFEDKK